MNSHVRTTPACGLILLPHVGKIGPDQRQVARVQGRDIVTDEPVAGTFDYQRKLVFRVEMPGGIITGATDHFAMKGFPLRARRLFKNRLHRRTIGPTK